MNVNEVAIKPSIQHFRLVAETEEKIKSFVESFIKSKLMGLDELLAEEKMKWIFFGTRSISVKSLPEDLAKKLDIYHYKNERVYFIYPTTLGGFPRYVNGGLFNLRCWISDPRRFKGSHKKEVLKAIDDGIIIPIRKADYVDPGWGNRYYFKQEDYIKKYKINLDWFEKKFSEDVEFFKEAARSEMRINSESRYHGVKYVVNKYGQPINVMEEGRGSYYSKTSTSKIEVDRKKGQLRLITDYIDCRCAILIDIKTNSLVGIKKEPVNNQIL